MTRKVSEHGFVVNKKRSLLVSVVWFLVLFFLPLFVVIAVVVDFSLFCFSLLLVFPMFLES